MVDFTTPNLCGANTDFNSLISKFVDIEKILTGNLNVDASALSGLLSPELTDLLTKVRELAPVAPTLPNISLQSQIGDLLDIDKSTVAGIGKYLALAAVIATYFDDELTVAGYSLTDIISKAGISSAAGGNICAAIPNFELPAVGGTAVEKATGVLQADVAPEIEKPSVLNKNTNITTAKTNVETTAAKWVNPDDKVVPTEDTGAYKVTKEYREIVVSDNQGGAITIEAATPEDSITSSTTVTETIEADTEKTKTITTSGGGVKEYKRANSSEKGLTRRPSFISGEITEELFTFDIEKPYNYLIELKYVPVKINAVWGWWAQSGKKGGRWVRIRAADTDDINAEAIAATGGDYIAGTHDAAKGGARDLWGLRGEKTVEITDLGGARYGPSLAGEDMFGKWKEGIYFKIKYSYLDNYDPTFAG